MSNLPSSSASDRSRILSAIGPATPPPCSPPCTITATTYFGFSKGAKQANHAVVSLCPRTVAGAVAPLDCLVHLTPESRLASKLYRPNAGNSICRHLRSPRRPLPIARAKQECIPDRLKHWRFELVTTSPGDDEFASTQAPANCRSVRR